MNNEKVLSNDELMEITAGFTIPKKDLKGLVVVSKYGIKPPIKTLYSVSPRIFERL